MILAVNLVEGIFVELEMLLFVFLFITFKLSSQSKLSVYSDWEKFTNEYIEGNLGLSSGCFKEVEKFVYGVKENLPWPLRIVEFDGNGKMDEHVSINKVVDNSTYCLVNLTIPQENGTTSGLFTEAICFPASCSSQEIYHGIFPTTIESNVKGEKLLDRSTICAIVVFGIILGLVVTSTTYELIMRYNAKPSDLLFKSFSLVYNGTSLLRVTASTSTNQISCLWGIRVIAMICVIYKHVTYVKENVTTEPLLSEWKLTLARKIIEGGTFSVDTFLLITGLLMSFNSKGFLKSYGKLDIAKYYLNRYFRLTPTLAVMVLIHVVLVSYLDFEQMMAKQHFDPLACRRYWWSALLYVQNFVNADRMCIGESWYLSVDMQIFLVSPIFLIPFRKKPKTVLSIIVILMLTSSAFSFATVWFFDMTSPINYLIYYNMKPYTRVIPWFLGFIMGYFLSISQESRLKVGQVSKHLIIKHQSKTCIIKAVNVLLTVTSMVAIIFCIYVLPWYSEDKVLYGSRLALIRPLWSVAICWIIYSCVTGSNDFINTLLSLNVFQVLSKVTYSAYLVHLTIIMLYHSVSKTATALTASTVFMEGCVYLVVIAITSTIVTLSVEMPAVVITKHILKT
ncbi:hypothetical protein FQA39_LY18348 [Lamprigera yunnana]|nr:hypothetical protein FQA39_LY18348 [Lamprigera yunnana]